MQSSIKFHNIVMALTAIAILWFYEVAAKNSRVVNEGATMKLSSPVFAGGAMIPVKYTCDGEDISPPLAWSGAPEGTRSFALIADDPDAPMGIWVHWVAYNIPAVAASLPEKAPAADTLPDGTRQGISDFKRPGYGGPCPPGGTHRYFFTLYALDVVLPAETKMTKAKLLAAMEGHVLAEARLMGKFKR